MISTDLSQEIPNHLHEMEFGPNSDPKGKADCFEFGIFPQIVGTNCHARINHAILKTNEISGNCHPKSKNI